jgi:hypothetical protein
MIFLQISEVLCRRFVLRAIGAALTVFAVGAIATDADAQHGPDTKRPAAGPLDDPAFFPIAVWLQNPSKAPQYKAAGINLYVGLWRGPADEQLAELKRHGMRVICSQNAAGLAHKDDPTILGWMHGDEPDNAQAIRGGQGYGPPILPEKIVDGYRRLKEADPSRPVLLNLGQGVAWDQWIGRGVRRNHPEDYPQYVRGCDIASFDIYPACHDHADVAGKLWMVADGVTRLKKWNDGKPVWNCIECTHVSNPKAKATPQQVKAEVWMSLVRGSRGIIYFVHQFQPQFIEAGLLADQEMLTGVTAINQQIHELAPLLNSPDVPGLSATSSSADVPVEAMFKRSGEDRYVFAVGMRDGRATCDFQLPDLAEPARAEVLGEDRRLDVQDGRFSDKFEPWDVHLYRIRPN